MRRVVAALVMVLVGCGPRGSTHADGARLDSVPVGRVADSLVLAAPGGAQVWLTAGREGRKADGTTCAERLIEIRTDTVRVRVPLLYTGDTPRLVDDSTLQARLWLHCEPGDTYRVHLRTGQPVKDTGRER